MSRMAVNTLDWWATNAAKRVGVSVGGPQDSGWRTAHWRPNGITAAESLVRLEQHVLVCWDWLRAFGLRDVCLNRVNSHPKSFLNDSPALQSRTGTINIQPGPRFACKVKQTAGGVSLFNVFQFEFLKCPCTCANQLVGRDFRCSLQFGEVITNNNCVVIPTRLSCSLASWKNTKSGRTSGAQSTGSLKPDILP